MTEMQWFRMYSEFATDPVVQALSFDDQRHFVMLLCFKCNGLLDRAFASPQQRIDVIRKSLGLDGKAWDEMRDRLGAMGLIDSELQPRAWNKRQFISDADPTAAERQRRRRSRLRHANVTRDSRSPDTETETEEDARETRDPPPDGLNLQAWEQWIQYRREIRKPFKPASIPAAQRKLAGFGSDQAAVVEQSIAQGWTGLFPLKDGPKAKAKERGFVC